MRCPVPTLCLISSLLVSSLAAQGYTTDFESPTFLAAPVGVLCAGQDGFYVPPVAGSGDGSIYTYQLNTIGVPTNPNGGANFYAGVGLVGALRSQRNVTPPTNSRCVIQFDILCNYTGTGVPVNNIGGVSLQPSSVITPQFPTASVFSNLIASWPTVQTVPLTWNANASFGPTLAGVNTILPDPAFQNLAVNVWHTWGTTIDFRTKEYINFRITNGVTNVTTIYTPPAPVPLTNQASTFIPTDFRLFTGNIANLFAVDNFTVTFGATYDLFGAGCAGAMGVPTLAPAPGSSPTIGTTLSINLGNLPLSLAVMCTGFSNTLAMGSIPLPFDLSSSGFPGCSLLVDPLSTQFLFGSSNVATWTLAIPLSTSFNGLEMFNQGLSLDTGPTGAAFSNGGRLVLGL